MTTLNISLPDELKRVVDERVARGNFASHSEYMRSLIREDQKRIEREQLEAKLLRRLQSGESVPMTDADFDHIRARLRSHVARTKKPRKAKK
jgi:antitoxin ParD1/3/4